jgi:hypothetical protein
MDRAEAETAAKGAARAPTDRLGALRQRGFREFVLNGIDGSWLDDPTKRRWRREWSREIDALITQLDHPEPMR